MKTIHLTWAAGAAALLALAPASVSAQQPEEQQLKIMTYNIRNAMGEDGVTNYDRVAEVIAEKEVEIAALQEVDSMTARSGRREVLVELAQRTGMHATFAPAIRYDGGTYGIGVLSREKPRSVRQIALPGREELRTLVVLEFDRYVLANMHLSLNEKDRLKSLKLLRQEAKRWDKPFIVTGDWNDYPNSELLKKIARDFELVNEEGYPTYPASVPTDCIDYIGIYRNDRCPMSVEGYYVVDAPDASDHRPLLSILQFEAEN